MERLKTSPIFIREAHELVDIEKYLFEYEKHLEQEVSLLQKKNQEVTDQSFSCASLSFSPLHQTTKHLLLLGGMGPLAGIYGMKDTLKYLDSSYSITLFQACFIPQRSVDTDITEPLYEAIVKALEHCPKDKDIALIVLCNSAHVFMDEVIQKIDTLSLNIKFHSFKESVKKHLETVEDKKSIALQTNFSLQHGFYKCDSGEVLDFQEVLMRAIKSVKEFEKNQAIKSAIELFKGLRNIGAQKILLGCTEIPILVEYIQNFGDEEMKKYLSNIELVNPLHLTLQNLGNSQ
jgi:aspartate racemase